MIDDENLKAMYQSIIMEHATSPRNFGPLNFKDVEKRVFNPFCGDDITIDLEFKHNQIQRASFYGDGCILCKASASMMTELVTKREVVDVQQISQKFVAMVTHLENKQTFDDLKEAVVFQNVAKFPVRVKCVLLPWEGLRNCLEGEENG